MAILVQSFLNSATRLSTTATTATTVAQLKTLVNAIEGVSTSTMQFYIVNPSTTSTVLVSGTLGSYGITTATTIYSSNTISTATNKADRQLAKLELAQLRRQAGGNTGTSYYRTYNVYDVDLLADKYTSNTTTVMTTSTLAVHRPWTDIPPFTFTEVINIAGATITETNVGPLTLEARATSYQVFPPVDGYIKVNGTTIKTTNLAATSRGHTLAVITPAGATVGTVTTYDTFESSPGDGGAGGRAALTSALNAVASGNYIVLVSWDACSLDAGVRSALTTGYGATLTTTWASTRYSHIFIGVKI